MVKGSEGLEYGIRRKGGRVLVGGGVEVESNGIERTRRGKSRSKLNLMILIEVVTFLLWTAIWWYS